MRTSIDVVEVNKFLETKTPTEIVRWAYDTFGLTMAVTTSFGIESPVLLDIVSQIDPIIPVFFINTGFHFQETLDYKEILTARLGLSNVIEVLPDPESSEFDESLDKCCWDRKVKPVSIILKPFRAWVCGIKRYQTENRKSVKIVDAPHDGLVKICPLVNFSFGESIQYIKDHKLPIHPLYKKKYTSVGCWPCTEPIAKDDNLRSGRWKNTRKCGGECGIHERDMWRNR